MTIYNKSDGYLPEDLLHSSIGHYGAAKLLLNEKPESFDSGGYILHLSVELMLKSWLLHINNEFDGTHVLQHLRQYLIESGINLPFTKQDNKVLDHLDTLYELRYPNRLNPTEIGTDTMQLAQNIIEKLFNYLPDDLYEAYNQIPDGTKGGRILMKKHKDIPIDVNILIKS